MGTSKGEEDAQTHEGEIEEELKKDETSGSLPTYQYSRVELMKIAERQAAKTRPACLSTEFNNSDGVWDPEKWVRSLQDSREASPLPGAEDRDRKRPGNVDREALRRKTSDPRERVKEDRDTIVLSPQRRSFGTGCHVSTTLSRQLSGGDYKESSERDRERREQRRIGSGRLNVDRDPRGGEREYRQIRFERDTGRFDRFRRDAEDRDRDKDRDRDIRDKRDFRSGFGGNSRRRQYNHHEEQPEWFTEGPTSQSDTIELRGFRGSSDDQKKKKRTEEEIEEEDAKEEARPDNKDKSNAVGVGDRNGSVETNDSSSPEAVQQGDSESKLFDFNTFFKLNDLPGLNPGDVSEATLESRFSRFFKGNSRENSRRSSFEGEFSFIHEMLDGKKSPGGASPTSPNGQQNFLPSYPMAVGEKPPSQPKSHASPLLQTLFLNNSSSSGDKGNGAPAPSFNIQDAEAQLKAMLLGGKKDSASSSGTASPASSSSNLMRKGKTVAELEAEIHHKTRETSEGLGERSGSSQSSREKSDDGDSSAFNKLLSLMKAGAAAPAAGAPDALRPPPMADDLRAISPGSRVSQPPHNEFMNALMRNKEQQLHLQQQSLQSQSLQTQGLSQLRLQQQALLQQAQQQQFLQQQQQQQQQQSFMQAHQTVLQQHQHQQQQQHFANLHRGNPDGLAGFMNPSIITKPPSPATRLPTVLPTTPQMNSPTPSSIPAAFLAKQGQVQASSARVPSPIMFGQQPPSHLSAPSPIHPMPRPLSGQGQALAPNALGGPQSNMRAGRVLSPQDLVLHTQAIMHNALIKKQLEDQKERFMKKQQERARSPNVTNVAGGQARPASASSMPGTPTPGQSKPVSVAFTPTSVIKKMHSDRVSEKEKTTKTDGEGDNQELGQGKSDRKPGEKLPPLSGPVGDAATREVMANCSNNTVQEGAKDGEGPRVNGPPSSQSLLKLPGSAVEPGQQADHNVNSASSMQTGSDPASMEFCLTQHNQGQALVNQLMGLGGSDKPKQARALVGQGAMQNAPSAAQNQQPPMQGRPIVKAAAPPIPPSSSPNASSMNPSSLPRPLMGASASRADVPGQRPIIGTGGGGGMGAGGSSVGAAAGHTSGGFSVDINKLMEQQRLLQQARQAVNPSLPVRPPMVSSAPFGMPITGRMPLQAGVVPPTTAQQAAASNALLMQQMIQAGRVNQLNQLHPFNQMAARQAAQQQRMVDPRLQLQGVRGFNGPLSPNRPGFVPFTALGQNANNNGTNTTNNNNNNSASASASKQGDSSILKWLSPDLVNQLPHLPPVPTPGHKVMTVDEIERSQQAVKN